MSTHAFELIRNFSIVAHIDHGKSTLADRLIQTTARLTAREMVEQVLDSMDIERERGITIKAQTVRLEYKAQDGKTYILNLMDTPGHVDFAYEVSRSLAACEGSLLVVDASQGVEAQTLANVYHALDADHEIVPVLNKIDLPAAEPERIKEQIEDVIGLDASQAVADLGEDRASHRGRAGGDRHPPAAAERRRGGAPEGAAGRFLVRRLSRRRRAGARHRRRLRKGPEHQDDGQRTPITRSTESACSRRRCRMRRGSGPGEVGFITAQIKEVADTRVGDTITDDRRPAPQALPGFKPVQPVVFCGLFPVDAADFEILRAAMGTASSERRELFLRDGEFGGARLRFPLRLSGAPASRNHSGAAGARVQPRSHRDRAFRHLSGLRCATARSVELHNPADMPDPMKIETIEEPWIRATILTPDDYLGAVLKLCQERRGVQVDLELCRQARDGRSTICRSTKWCSISTTG